MTITEEIQLAREFANDEINLLERGWERDGTDGDGNEYFKHPEHGIWEAMSADKVQLVADVLRLADIAETAIRERDECRNVTYRHARIPVSLTDVIPEVI